MARPKNPDSLDKATTPEQALALGFVNGDKDQTFSVDDVPTNRKHSEELQVRIDKAEDVLQRKASLNAEAQELREACTLLTNTGSGDRKQVAWIRFYLPRKRRKSGNGGDSDDDE